MPDTHRILQSEDTEVDARFGNRFVDVLKNPENDIKKANDYQEIAIASVDVGRARGEVDRSFPTNAAENLTPKESMRQRIVHFGRMIFEARRYKLDSEFSVSVVTDKPQEELSRDSFDLAA